jgi:hypothetical protein
LVKVDLYILADYLSKLSSECKFMRRSLDSKRKNNLSSTGAIGGLSIITWINKGMIQNDFDHLTIVNPYQMKHSPLFVIITSFYLSPSFE